VRLHGGDLRAESDGIGSGATFIVSVPLAKAPT
jgi:signal transduction histidine kinase